MPKISTSSSLENIEKEERFHRERGEQSKEDNEDSVDDWMTTNNQEPLDGKWYLQKRRKTSFKAIRRKGSLVLNASMQKIFGERHRL